MNPRIPRAVRHDSMTRGRPFKRNVLESDSIQGPPISVQTRLIRRGMLIVST